MGRAELQWCGLSTLGRWHQVSRFAHVDLNGQEYVPSPGNVVYGRVKSMTHGEKDVILKMNDGEFSLEPGSQHEFALTVGRSGRKYRVIHFND
jgi:hypothetical protein